MADQKEEGKQKERSNSIDKLFMEQTGSIYYTSIGTSKDFQNGITSTMQSQRKLRSKSELKKLFGSESALKGLQNFD